MRIQTHATKICCFGTLKITKKLSKTVLTIYRIYFVIDGLSKVRYFKLSNALMKEMSNCIVKNVLFSSDDNITKDKGA